MLHSLSSPSPRRWTGPLALVLQLITAVTILATLTQAAPPLVERALTPLSPFSPIEERANSLEQYIVSFERTVTDEARQKVKQALEWEGAKVINEYNFKIYKAIIYSPASESARPLGSPSSLAEWVSTLTKMDGVKGVEQDQLVNAN